MSTELGRQVPSQGRLEFRANISIQTYKLTTIMKGNLRLTEHAIATIQRELWCLNMDAPIDEVSSSWWRLLDGTRSHVIVFIMMRKVKEAMSEMERVMALGGLRDDWSWTKLRRMGYDGPFGRFGGLLNGRKGSGTSGRNLESWFECDDAVSSSRIRPSGRARPRHRRKARCTSWREFKSGLQSDGLVVVCELVS